MQDSEPTPFFRIFGRYGATNGPLVLNMTECVVSFCVDCFEQFLHLFHCCFMYMIRLTKALLDIMFQKFR